jgi:uracil-DNA glycosylase
MTDPNAESDRKRAKLQEIAEEIRHLAESPLYEYRQANDYAPVVGEGDPNARIMFIGEAPGKEEAETGRPFVGAAGRILDELLQSIGVTREQVYITNVLKDRPPGNRDPRADEIDVYSPFLLRQVSILKPEVIVTLGRFAMNFVLDQFGGQVSDRRITQIHGQPLDIEAPHGRVVLLPMFHPAATFYGGGRREALEEDFQTLKEYL